MIKVGMTRRLELMDRIRELGDASVPFRFDVHAVLFSENAMDIESQMLRHLASRRVNQVNQRCEFFYAMPTEARDFLMSLTGELLRFDELTEAVAYRQSQAGPAHDSGAIDSGRGQRQAIGHPSEDSRWAADDAVHRCSASAEVHSSTDTHTHANS